MKRAFDVIFAMFGLLMLAPLMAVIGLAIKLGDRGPAIFSQTRVGRFGRHFRICKFRTMVLDAETKGIPLTAGDDRRITRVGRWLRRTKLDELPQLWNVIKGDMSLVGPRPEVPRYVAFYTADQRRVLDVRPGITDPASLEYFQEANVLACAANPELTYTEQILPHKLAINLSYLQRQSIVTDVGVIFATLWRIVSPFNRINSNRRSDPHRRAA